ncbi:hypothetical protein MKW94_012247 [Papaver nudicaule]|uniref:nucleoside-diphosphate kinase n=1 Tax=Papaver nudicaule TaxID=74823 RepID=A0AA41V5F3_PAPNU|nr:hypothetical protein [Papaver nudicaule]
MPFEEEKKLPPMKRPKLMVEEEDMEKMVMERAFILCYPDCVFCQFTGKILHDLEKSSLSIKRIRLVCATEKFLDQFFSMEGRNIFEEKLPGSIFCPYPFVAVEVEGHNANEKVRSILPESVVRVYSSGSAASREEDCGLWFGGTDSAADWMNEAVKSSQLACALPNGDTFGPVETVVQKLLEEDHLKSSRLKIDTVFRDFYDNFYHEDLTFVLIKPRAFEVQCVGEVLFHLEKRGRGIRGLNMVTECDALPADSHGYGIALVMQHFDHAAIRIITTCGDAPPRIIDRDTVVEISSDLIHLGKAGDRSMIADYFKCGAVSWVNPSTGASCGGYFLANLSSLQF